MITLQLRELEADGIVSRTVIAEVPPRVEYDVTEYGRSLEPILIAMQDWGREFKVKRAAAEGCEVPESAGCGSSTSATAYTG